MKSSILAYKITKKIKFYDKNGVKYEASIIYDALNKTLVKETIFVLHSNGTKTRMSQKTLEKLYKLIREEYESNKNG